MNNQQNVSIETLEGTKVKSVNHLKHDDRRAIAILRVSSGRQKDNSSHHVQREMVERYCEEVKLNLVKIVEIVESAKRSEERKKYHAIKKWALSNGIKHIVFYMSDRESRNLKDNEENEYLVRQGLLVLHYAQERKSLHKDSADSEFMMRDFQAAQSKQFSRALSAKVRDAMKSKAMAGWYPSNSVPLGYIPNLATNESVQSKSKNVVGLHPNPKTQQQVIREYELRAQGKSYEEIRIQIIKEGFIPRGKEKNFFHSVIEQRLKNPFYRGRFYWAGEEYVGKHPLFISKELATQVDRTFGKSNFKVRSITDENALGGGWLLCGDCGCNIVFEKKVKKYRNGTTKVFRYYHCTNGKRVHPNLKGMNIPEEKVWEQLERAIDAVTLNEQLAAEISEALNQAQAKAKIAMKRQMEGFRAAIQASYADEDALYQDLKKGTLSEDMYSRLIGKVRSERDRLSMQLESAQLSIADAGAETAKSILELCTSAKSLWKSRTPLERKNFLNSLLSNPTLNGPTVRYELKKPFRLLSEMAQSSEWRSRLEEFRTSCIEAYAQAA